MQCGNVQNVSIAQASRRRPRPMSRRLSRLRRVYTLPSTFPSPFRWLTAGIYSGANKRRHLKSLRELQPHEDDAFEHNYLYNCLSILDVKATALLQFDSILIAASSFVLASISKDITAGSITVFAALVFSGLSSFCCLDVIWIHWTDTTEFHDSDRLFVRLLEVRNRRTVAYRLAWVVSLFAMLTLIVGIFLQRRLP
jgi:hypothetical protein